MQLSAWLARAKENVNNKKLLNIDKLFESLSDNGVKAVLDSVQEQKIKMASGQTSERTIDWADKEVPRLHKTGLKGIENVSAFHLYNVYTGWNKKGMKTVATFKRKFGYMNSESAPKKKRASTSKTASDLPLTQLTMKQTLDSLGNGIVVNDETLDWLGSAFDADNNAVASNEDVDIGAFSFFSTAAGAAVPNENAAFGASSFFPVAPVNIPLADDDRKPPADDDSKHPPSDITNFAEV